MRHSVLEGRADLIGTSGTVTSLAGVILGLPRYHRSRVDGCWFDVGDCRATIAPCLANSLDERAANACIGKDRADLVVIGGAILDAVLRVWPTSTHPRRRSRLARRRVDAADGAAWGALMSDDPPEPKRRWTAKPTGGADERQLTQNVRKTRRSRKARAIGSSANLNDPYVARARADGYRARAAYKLIELDEKFHFLKRGMRVIDLGAAPGGWAQVAVQRGVGKIVGVDLLASSRCRALRFSNAICSMRIRRRC